MSDLFVVGILFVLVLAAAYAGARTYQRGSRSSPVVWGVSERHNDDDLYEVRCVHPPDAPILIDAIPCGAPDFDERLETARLEAELKVGTLNRGATRRLAS